MQQPLKQARKKVMVTGANGFLGSWLVRELLAEDVSVIAVLRAPEEDLSDLPADDRLRVVFCDMADFLTLPDLLPERDVDCLIHLAWAGSAGPARGDMRLQLNNAAAAADAARAAARLGCRRFVGAGSLAEKDCLAYVPLPGARPNAVTGYGTAKLAAQYMSKAVCAAENIEHVWAYLPNSYGERNRTQNFVNFAAGLMLSGQRASFTSGEQQYEFVYAGDTAAGIWAVAQKGKPFCAYYIGGSPRQLKEYIRDIRDAIDPSIPLYLGEVPFNAAAQPAELYDAAELKADTGFAVQVPFSEGIRRTVAWLRAEREKGAKG